VLQPLPQGQAWLGTAWGRVVKCLVLHPPRAHGQALQIEVRTKCRRVECRTRDTRAHTLRDSPPRSSPRRETSTKTYGHRPDMHTCELPTDNACFGLYGCGRGCICSVRAEPRRWPASAGRVGREAGVVRRTVPRCCFSVSSTNLGAVRFDFCLHQRLQSRRKRARPVVKGGNAVRLLASTALLGNIELVDRQHEA